MRDIAMRLVLVAATIASTTAVAGCSNLIGPGDNSLLREQLAESEARWQRNGFANYTMLVERGPLFADGYRSVVVHVNDRRVTAAFYEDTGQPVEPDVLAEQQSVEQLFDLIRDALDRRAPGIGVSYQEELGHPSLIQIDYDLIRTGDEIHIAVGDLTPSG
jgi:hypothetical protein